jgi:hypothetical protein
LPAAVQAALEHCGHLEITADVMQKMMERDHG